MDAHLAIKADKLNSPVAEADDGGVGEVDVGDPALDSADLATFALEFFLVVVVTLIMPLRLSADTCK